MSTYVLKALSSYVLVVFSSFDDLCRTLGGGLTNFVIWRKCVSITRRLLPPLSVREHSFSCALVRGVFVCKLSISPVNFQILRTVVEKGDTTETVSKATVTAEYDLGRFVKDYTKEYLESKTKINKRTTVEDSFVSQVRFSAVSVYLSPC